MFSPCGAPVLKTTECKQLSFPFGAVLKQRRSNVKFGRKTKPEEQGGCEEWLSFFGLKSATVHLEISKSVSRT